MKKFIFGLQRFSKISIGAGISNSVVSGTSDKDIISNNGSLITIQAGEGDDSINNRGQIVKIYGDNGADTIRNYGDNVAILAGEGNDYVYNQSNSDNVTISGGAGSDSIYSFGKYTFISGGADNDTIRSSYGNNTIIGGSGDDYISLVSNGKNNVIEYAQGDGADVIVGFGSSSKNGNTLISKNKNSCRLIKAAVIFLFCSTTTAQ